MPRNLGDVFHYFFEDEQAEKPAERRSSQADLRPLPLLAVPVGDQDVVCATTVWNLAVEIARRGATACVVAPAGAETEALWPEPGKGPLGAELVLAFAETLADLERAARDVAATSGASSRDGGIVLVRIPPAWLSKAADAGQLFDWTLLFSAPEREDLLGTYSTARHLLELNRQARIGVTIRGPRSVEEARQAFDRLDAAARRNLQRSLDSYGLLVDDVHVYRAIVTRRPVGISHPRSVATRALQDVARLLLDDARGGRRA